MQESGVILIDIIIKPKDSWGLRCQGFCSLTLLESQPTQPIVETHDKRKKHENANIAQDVMFLIATKTNLLLIL